MANEVEQQDIRGLEIDKVVKGFALVEYVFKGVCTVSNTSSDHIRWYQETPQDLTASAPQVVANISPLSTFPILEVSWIRNTDYVRKFANEDMISMEDMKSADIDVIARTLLRLTRAVVKQVDTYIYDILTDGQKDISGIGTGTTTPVINTNFASGAWNLGAAADPISDIMEAKRLMWVQDYNPEGATMFISPLAHRYLLQWLINTKGSSIPATSDEKIKSGVVMSLLGINIRVSNNVTGTSGAAVMVIPQKACTWKTFTDTTSVAIENKGIGTTLRVYEQGVGYLTDPKAVTMIKGIESAAG